MGELTTIPVHKETRDKLKNFGAKGDTYDDILRRLMEIVEYEEFMESQYKRLREKERFVPLEEL
ncbi:MAG: hypothetical protein ACE5PM_07405 [Candidatus Hydrothermarchaeales archaeon]